MAPSTPEPLVEPPRPASSGALGRSLVNGQLHGWAIGAEPREAATVELFIDDVLVGAVATDQPRPDLEPVLGYVPKAGFLFKVPDEWFDGGSHRVKARIAGSEIALKHSGREIEFPASRAPAPPAAQLDGIVSTKLRGRSIIGWAWDAAAPASHVEVELLSDGVSLGRAVASEFRKDLQENGIGNGDHGFSLPIPEALMDGRPHQVAVHFVKGPSLRRGELDIGPLVSWPEQGPFAEQDAGGSGRHLYLAGGRLDLPALSLHTGVTVEFSFRLHAVDPDTQGVSLRLGRATGRDGAPRPTLLHVFGQGNKAQPVVPLVHDPATNLWRATFRLLLAGPGGTAVTATLGEVLKVAAALVIPPGSEAAEAEPSLVLPIGLRTVSPAMFNILDVEKRSRATNHSDMLVTGAADDKKKPQIHPLGQSFPDYIPPLVIGYVDDDLRDDLACVTRHVPFEMQNDAREQILQSRADLCIVQAARLSHERLYDAQRAAPLVQAIEACRLARTPVVLLLDTADAAERQRLAWFAAEADVVVDFAGEEAKAIPAKTILREKPFISPGRVNAFVSKPANPALGELVRGQRPWQRLLDGFWDVLEIRDEETWQEIDRLRGDLKVIESRFAFSRFRAVDARDLYWNLLGCISPALRPHLMAQSDELVLLPNTSADYISRYRAILEAVAVRTAVKMLPPAGGQHAFAPIIDDLAALKVGGDELSTVKRLAQGNSAMLGVLRNFNTKDFIDRILRLSHPVLADHNKQALRPKISCLLISKRPHLVTEAIQQIARQAYDNIEIIVIIHGEEVDEGQMALWRDMPLVSLVENLPRSRTLGFCLNYAIECSTGTFIAKFDDDDLYGEHHLSDFVDYLQCAQIELFARPLGFVYLAESGTLIQQTGALDVAFGAYGKTNFNGFQGAGGTIIVSTTLARRVKFSEVRRGGLDSDFVTRAIERTPLVLGDSFGFALCRYGKAGDHTWLIDDKSLAQRGIELGTNIPKDTVNRLIDGDLAAWSDLQVA